VSTSPAPKVGFVSLGCPKALVDSERILTQLRAEGYLISPTYEDAELVVVNTCGFIDAAVQESLEAIGEALEENGKVIVTGCLGAKGDVVRQTHPKVLAVTGPHATDEVMRAVHAHLPKPHDPLASGSHRATTPISRLPKAAITAARSASSRRCGATS
jgi:ribosomal protein S12 methylthiotransferase